MRLGTIVRPKNIQEEDLKQLIIDAEATLIYCCEKQLLQNKMCTKSCHTSQRLKILNTGWRGNLPAEVCIPDDKWTYD